MNADTIIRELREALDAIPEDEREWSLRMRPMRVLADVRDGLGEYVADTAMAEDARYIAAASPARVAVLLDHIESLRRLLREERDETRRRRVREWTEGEPPQGTGLHYLVVPEGMTPMVARWSTGRQVWIDRDLRPMHAPIEYWMPLPQTPGDLAGEPSDLSPTLTNHDAAGDQRRETVVEALREAGVCPTCRGRGCWPCAGTGRVRSDDAPSLWQTGDPPAPGIYITSYADMPPDEDWTGIDYWDGDEWEETMDDRTPDFWMPLPPTPRATP